MVNCCATLCEVIPAKWRRTLFFSFVWLFVLCVTVPAVIAQFIALEARMYRLWVYILLSLLVASFICLAGLIKTWCIDIDPNDVEATKKLIGAPQENAYLRPLSERLDNIFPYAATLFSVPFIISGIALFVGDSPYVDKTNGIWTIFVLVFVLHCLVAVGFAIILIKNTYFSSPSPDDDFNGGREVKTRPAEIQSTLQDGDL